MTTWKKAVSTLATAGLLASLLATTVAGTASAAVVMSPTTGPNTGGTLVSVTGGAGFTISTLVSIGTNNVGVTSVSPDGTSLTFVTPDVSTATPSSGLFAVSTTNPVTIGLPGFLYTTGAPGAVTLTPATGKVGTSVTLVAPGQNIPAGVPTVRVADYATAGGPFFWDATSVIRNNSTSVSFLIPAGACPAAGTATRGILVNQTGGAAGSPGNPGTSAIVGIPAFGCNVGTTFAMVPTSGPVGAVVQLTGDIGSFDLGCRIQVNALPATPFISPTSVGADGSRLTFVIPTGQTSGKVTIGGCVNSTTALPSDAGADTGGTFTVTGTGAGTAVVPSTAVEAGGTVIQVTGTGFTGATQVFLSAGTSSASACVPPGGIIPTTVAADGKSLTFVMPAKNSLGTAAVAPATGRVCNAATALGATVYVWPTPLAAAAAGSVTYQAAAGAPGVTSVSPNSGSRLGGNTVTITGTSFVSGATVAFGAAAATSVTFVSATSLTAVVPAGVGVVPVTVRNPDAQSGQLPGGYTYTDTGFVCGNATALGVTTSGPFTTSTKVAALNGYVTYAMGCGVAAAGQIITIHRSVQTPASGGGTWSAFTPFTSRVANSGGTVFFYARSSSAAWWSFRAAISGFTSPARQARWR